MFIRRKTNKNGSISILLLTGERKPGRKYSISRMIKNFGTSRDEEELKTFIQQAEEYKKHLLLISPKASTLKIISPRDIKSCQSFIAGFSDVYGTFFDSIFLKNLNLKQHELKKLHDLIVMRIAEPASKRKTAMISREYGIDCGVDSIYKLMDELTENTIIQAKKIIYNHSIELLKEQKETVDVMFYDLTTIYFETNSDDTLRNFGFSKDGKCQHVQIMLAVIVTKHGLPIDYEEFPGNCYEGHTLIPVIEKIKTRYNIDQTVLVADAALMNTINLSALTEKKINYVIAARVKNMKKNIKENILDQAGYRTISSTKEDSILCKEIKLETGTLVAFHSSKRARKDAHEREKALDKIQQYLNSTAKSQLTSRLKKPYVKVSKGVKLEIDLNKLNQEKLFDGFFGIQTNLEKINAKEILNTYRGLWQVEQTFRIAKSNLEIRPVFHYNTDRIRAHFLICYMSLALIRYVEFELQKNNLHYPIDQLHFLLNQMRLTKIHHADNNMYVLLEDAPAELISVYQALNIKWHKKFSQEAVLL